MERNRKVQKIESNGLAASPKPQDNSLPELAVLWKVGGGGGYAIRVNQAFE